MSASGFEAATPGGWSWPEDIQVPRNRMHEGQQHSPSSYQSTTTADQPGADTPKSEQDNTEEPPRERHYKPRTCRICLETVNPTYTPAGEGIFQSKPKIVYESEDGGRLLRPCKCKGTAKYVHEGCLQAWRHADPGYARRNFFQCPTCSYKYRLQRLGWGRLVTSVGKCHDLSLILNARVLVLSSFPQLLRLRSPSSYCSLLSSS